MVVDRNTELRKLRPAELYNIALILSPSDNWKKLVSVVTKEGTEDVAKFNGETISILEQASRHERRPSAAIFFEEWATMGRKRPTLGILLDLLLNAELFRAADYLAKEILKIEAPLRPTTGPAVAIDVEGALAEMLVYQNLESEAKFEGSDHNHSSEINLRNICYPIDILKTKSSKSDNNCAVNNNQIGYIDMQYSQSKPTNHLARADYTNSIHINDIRKNNFFNAGNEFASPNEIKNIGHDCKKSDSRDFLKKSKISDLMKFSVSEMSHIIENHVELSDLIKFESVNIDVNDDERRNIGMSESMLPNFHILCPKSLKNDHPNGDIKNLDESSIETKHNGEFLREMPSKVLPAVLKDSQVSDYYHHELSSSELPVFVNNRSGFDMDKTNSSDDNTSLVSDSISKSNGEKKTNFEENGSNVESVCFGKNEFGEGHKIQDNVNSCELPITVLAFRQR